MAERIFTHCPKLNMIIDPALEQSLPIGWFLVYANCYSKFQP